MPATLRYSGLDLPVYGPETPLTDVADLRRAAPEQLDTLTADTFLRDVRISVAYDARDATHVPGNLLHILERTDEELAIAAELCGAEVVGHQWGLFHDPDGVQHRQEDRSALYGAEHLIPEDHYLVAEVDIIRGAVNMSPLNALRIFQRTGLGAVKVAFGLKAYELGRRERVYHLHDMMPSQFVVGTSAAADESQDPGFWLVDIEPRLVF